MGFRVALVPPFLWAKKGAKKPSAYAALAKTAFHSAAQKKLTLAASFSLFLFRSHSCFGLCSSLRRSDSFLCGRFVPSGFLTPGLLRSGSTAGLQNQGCSTELPPFSHSPLSREGGTGGGAPPHAAASNCSNFNFFAFFAFANLILAITATFGAVSTALCTDATGRATSASTSPANRFP